MILFWQRAGLSGLAAFEIVTFLGLATKAGASLASKSIYQISTSAMARETARKGANYSVQKTGTLAAEKRIAQKSVQGVSRGGINRDLNALSKAGQVMDRGGLTKAGRALDKHGGRPDSVFPKALGNPASKNMQGQFHLDDILTQPNSIIKQHNRPKYGNVTDIRIPGNRGVRYSQEGDFIMFLEP